MSGIVSKNLYELLGNDADQDPDREPEPPTKAVEKPIPRTGKRNAGAEGPPAETSRPRGGGGGGGRGGRHDNFTGNEQAFRDRGAGSYNNRSKPADDGLRQDRHPDRLRGPDEHREGGNRGRGSRGRGYQGRGPRTGRDDRHSRTGLAEHDKQAAHGWGGQTGGDEWADEKAGEAIAKEEEKDGFDANPPAPVNAEGEPFVPEATTDGAGADGDAAPATEAEPEDKTKSYEAYLAEVAEKKLQLGNTLEPRKPNEGGSKKMPEGKAIEREDEEDFMAGSGGKAKRERQRKEKAFVELDDAKMREEVREGGAARGRGRGGGRGDRGDRGDRSHRPERRDRGGFRGDRAGFRGDRGGGEFRGGRGGRAGAPAPRIDDASAFPSLGGK